MDYSVLDPDIVRGHKAYPGEQISDEQVAEVQARYARLYPVVREHLLAQLYPNRWTYLASLYASCMAAWHFTPGLLQNALASLVADGLVEKRYFRYRLAG